MVERTRPVRQPTAGGHGQPRSDGAAGDRRSVAAIVSAIGAGDRKIARSRLAAPFDGIVISGDLSQQIGAPVETGKKLFEIAPLQSYRIILQVDEQRKSATCGSGRTAA